jgi:hypothetical protein
MKLTRGLLALALTFSLSLLSFLTLPTRTAIAQDSKVALQRGYRTGYSDGYMAGYRDTIDSASKDFTRHKEYSDASRAYNKDYGSIEDYRDGYQQGFEAGYATGFEKRSFESAIPGTLHRRGNEAANTPVDVPATPVSTESEPAQSSEPVAQSQTSDSIRNVSYQSQSDAIVIIPRDTELILELIDPLSTEKNREGDKFTAKVVSPSEIAGAVVEGRIDRIEKPGRIKKRSEMLLSFDRIVLSETRWSNFDAILTEVLPVKGDNVKRVDEEGAAVGKSTIKPDSAKVGAATGAGAGIGAISGGPVGAAVGAGIGAAFGVGAVVIERGKHINLNPNQQLRIRTSYETRIR